MKVCIVNMVKKSKLLAALDAHKGINYELERQKALHKKAENKKRMLAASKSLGNAHAETTVVRDNENKPQVEDDSPGWTSDVSKSHLLPAPHTNGSP